MDTWWEISKNQLRIQAKQILAAISSEDKKQQSNSICKRLEQQRNKYHIWAVFIPFMYEPNIFPFVEELWEKQKTVLVPQIDGESLHLAYYNTDSVVTQWIYGEWIIQNPVWYDGWLDVCLVPWLAFDRQGNRLGHGKWYYDRFLATNTCFRIGVGYNDSVVEKVPFDDLDQRMDVVIV